MEDAFLTIARCHNTMLERRGIVLEREAAATTMKGERSLRNFFIPPFRIPINCQCRDRVVRASYEETTPHHTQAIKNM
jgi:hypothetical protein